MKTLAGCKGISYLQIENTEITSEGLAIVLEGCTRLARLWLADCPKIISFEECKSESLSSIEICFGLSGVTSFKPNGMPNLRQVRCSLFFFSFLSFFFLFFIFVYFIIFFSFFSCSVSSLFSSLFSSSVLYFMFIFFCFSVFFFSVSLLSSLFRSSVLYDLLFFFFFLSFFFNIFISLFLS